MELATGARALAVELLGRLSPSQQVGPSVPPRFHEYVGTMFAKQREVLASPYRKNAVPCTRRAGKSKTIPALLFEGGEKHPGTVVYYLHPDGGTRAWETVMGPDINLQAINETYALGWEANANRRTFTHPRTRTEIRVRGADDAREIRKYRGDKVSRVVVDEAQNFPGELLRELVDQHLGPALADIGGQWFLCGTVGDVCAGLWYELTRNETPDSALQRNQEWALYSWSALDNPHVAQNIALEIAPRIVRAAPGVTEAEVLALLATPEGRKKAEALAAGDPTTVREWFGRWVNDSGALFYAFDSRRNVYSGALPPGHTWVHVAGADLGTGDDFAYHVWAVSHTHPTVYERESFSKAGLHEAQWREHVADVVARYQPLGLAGFVVDEGGLGKGVCDAWRDVHGLPVTPAEKTRKAAAVATLNAELREGRVKVLADAVPSLGLKGGATARDWATLRKSKTTPPGKPPEEEPGQKNHAADSALYSFREAMRFVGREDAPARRESDAERHARQEAEAIAAMEARVRAQESESEWE